MKHHLQQEIAELVAQVVEIAARDGIGNFIGFLDRVGRDGRKILFEIPRAAAAGRAQHRHDFEQAGNIAGRGHPAPGLMKIRLYAASRTSIPAKRTEPVTLSTGRWATSSL